VLAPQPLSATRRLILYELLVSPGAYMVDEPGTLEQVAAASSTFLRQQPATSS
jgi:hypothetical protein